MSSIPLGVKKMRVQSKAENQAVAQAVRRAHLRGEAPQAAGLEIIRGGPGITVEDVKAAVEERAKAALELAMQRGQPEITEPYPWWELYALGPIQGFALNGPLPPHQIIKVGETAFVATVIILNPTHFVAPGMSAAHLLSSLSLPFEVRYQTGNKTTWTLGDPGMNVAHGGAGMNLVPGVFVYVDVLQFTGNAPGLYEMNVSARLLGATPPFVNAPQFAGYCRSVVDFDPDLLFPAPGMQFDQPIRFQVYP
jgi:hypothetical protein